MLYLKKKMYAAIMYEHPLDKGKLDIKGIALARGDSSNLTKGLQLQIIQCIMKEPTNAWDVVLKMINEAIQHIKNERTSLIKSRKLGDNYKFPERQVQWQVAEKMKERGQDVPQIGERVYYLVAKGQGGVCKRADNPDNVIDLDYNYYIDSQILKPMKNILDALCKDWKQFVNVL
jgi:DNA polymerase delta subunit 1